MVHVIYEGVVNEGATCKGIMDKECNQWCDNNTDDPFSGNPPYIHSICTTLLLILILLSITAIDGNSNIITISSITTNYIQYLVMTYNTYLLPFPGWSVHSSVVTAVAMTLCQSSEQGFQGELTASSPGGNQWPFSNTTTRYMWMTIIEPKEDGLYHHWPHFT